MTLSRWLRDYLYIPLGGNRERPAAHVPEPDAHDAARRALARRRVDVRRLGRLHGVGLALERWWRDAAAVRPSARDRAGGRLGAAPHLPRRVPRLDLLPGGLVRARLGPDRGPVHRVGPALAPRHDAASCSRSSSGSARSTSCAASARLVMARFSRLPVLGQATVLALALMLDERAGPGGRGTLHLLPVLMPEPRPPLTVLRSSRTRPGPSSRPLRPHAPGEARRRRRRRRARPAVERRPRAHRVRARARHRRLAQRAGRAQVGLQQGRRLAARCRARPHRPSRRCEPRVAPRQAAEGRPGRDGPLRRGRDRHEDRSALDTGAHAREPAANAHEASPRAGPASRRRRSRSRPSTSSRSGSPATRS